MSVNPLESCLPPMWNQSHIRSQITLESDSDPRWSRIQTHILHIAKDRSGSQVKPESDPDPDEARFSSESQMKPESVNLEIMAAAVSRQEQEQLPRALSTCQADVWFTRPEPRPQTTSVRSLAMVSATWCARGPRFSWHWCLQACHEREVGKLESYTGCLSNFLSALSLTP